jgi:hypothetical protein
MAGWRSRLLMSVVLASVPAGAGAQEPPEAHPQPAAASEHRGGTAALFLAGAALGLVAHEGGHLLLDVVFDADPDLRRVDFHGIPFFAIAHRADLSPRRAYAAASAGFLVQHAGSEWLLTRRPDLRRQRAPLAKGVLAFNVLTSVAYAGAAFARTGPHERDTLGMANHARLDERSVAALVLAPAALDAWRYFRPESKWAVWASRAAKAGMVLLVIR